MAQPRLPAGPKAPRKYPAERLREMLLGALREARTTSGGPTPDETLIALAKGFARQAAWDDARAALAKRRTEVRERLASLLTELDAADPGLLRGSASELREAIGRCLAALDREDTLDREASERGGSRDYLDQRVRRLTKKGALPPTHAFVRADEDLPGPRGGGPKAWKDRFLVREFDGHGLDLEHVAMLESLVSQGGFPDIKPPPRRENDAIANEDFYYGMSDTGTQNAMRRWEKKFRDLGFPAGTHRKHTASAVRAAVPRPPKPPPKKPKRATK